MKNKLIDLNNHLFEQIERLNDDDIMQGDKFEKELQRSKALSNLAAQVINNAKVALEGFKAINDGTVKRAPEMLGAGELEKDDAEI